MCLDSQGFLRAMVEEAGVSGYEGRVSEIVRKAFGELCDAIREDKLGNIIGLKKGSGSPGSPKIMLAGHMDEVGLTITKIDKRGYLRFAGLGVDQRTLPAQEVVVHGSRDLPGVICVKPPHLLKPEDREKAYRMEDLGIDLGLPEQRVRELVNVGDAVTLSRKFYNLQGEFIAGKALDDRVGVAVIHECLSHLTKMKHEADVYAVATVQEEVGLRGATTATYGIVPDAGIAIDVTFAEYPGGDDPRLVALDKGPALDIGPNIHPKMLDALRKTASDNNIPYQTVVTPGRSGTDAWPMQVTGAGVPTAIVSIPNRYMHSSVEVCNMSDIKKAGRLLALFILTVDRSFVEGLACY
jgi:endoglucanase